MFSNVISKDDLRQVGKRLLLTALLLLVLIVVGLIVNAVAAQRKEKNFELAADFPRGALVYAQFADLPALLKQWDESALKERYLASNSFQQLQSRHLAIKLLSRWSEFNDAAGFPIDLATLSGLADNRAAIAIYDIGKLDLMLIAPMSEAKFEACSFVQGKENFEQIELPGGTSYFLRDVEADRGRQKQHIAFAHLNGRFVLATSEKLLLRAIVNLNGQAKRASQKDHLTDEPSFQSLSNAVAPHLITVWVDQSKLNDDWYFKHYWLMSEIADLKNIRAGMFDLEMQQGSWVERREFLLNGNVNVSATLPKQTLQRVERIVPADVPFVQLRAVDGNPAATAELVGSALFDGKVKPENRHKRDRSWEYYSDSEFEPSSSDGDVSGEDRYSYLSYGFDSVIDEMDDDAKEDNSELRWAGEQKFARSLQLALQPTRPLAAAKLARPRAIEGPLFAEFARATILTLQNPSALVAQNQASLERAIGELAANRLMVAGVSGKFEWKTRNENGVSWREMELPVLGRAVGYGVRGTELILSNNRELLATLMTGKTAQSGRDWTASPVHELTIIRLNQRNAAFDQIFAQLEAPLIRAYWQQRLGENGSGQSQEFFSGEISSLLDVAAPVDEVRIQRSYASGRLHEEVRMLLK